MKPISEEEKSELDMFEGVCKYCGQHKIEYLPYGSTQQDADEKASMECRCSGGQKARELKFAKELGEKAARAIFKNNEAMLEVIEPTIGSIVYGEIDKVTVKNATKTGTAFMKNGKVFCRLQEIGVTESDGSEVFVSNGGDDEEE